MSKRISMLTTWFDSNGGAEQALNILVDHMCKNYEIILVVLNPKVSRSTLVGTVQSNLTRINIRSRVIFRAFSVPSLRDIVSVIRNTKGSACVFVHQYYTFSAFLGAVCSYFNRIPLILKPIAPIPTEYPPTSKLAKFVGWLANRTICYFVLKQSAVILPTSRYEKNYIEHLHIPSSKIIVVPSGIDSKFLDVKDKPKLRETFRRSHGILPTDKIVLYVGRIHEMKGLEQVVSILPSILDAKLQVFLFIVGRPDPIYLTKLKLLAKELRILDRIVFLGYRENASLLECYAAADVFVNPSYMEAAPLAIREAIAFGLPVVATNVGGTREFVTNANVVLFKPGDLMSLSSAIIETLQRPATIVRPELPTWDGYVKRMSEVFNDFKK